MATNCAVTGDNPRSISLAAGQNALVSFAVTCSATFGTLQITTTTTGPSPDADGYTVILDGIEHGTLDATGTVDIAGLQSGDHAVALSGVVVNCQVQGDNPRSVTVSASGTAGVSFAVTCTAPLPGSGLRWQTMASGTNLNLSGVWGSSGTDVFAVGSDNQGTATILHYDGRAWSEQARKVGIFLGSVWGSAATDVFAVGYEAAILHQDGTGWQALPRPDVDVPTFFTSVWGTSGTDVFAVGGNVSGSTPAAEIIHYDGTRWSTMSLTPYIDRQLNDVAGSSSRDVYAVGYFSPHGEFPPDAPNVIYHYDGVEWKEVTLPAFGSLTLSGVWASSPADVFVVGQGRDRVVLHFDGHTWSRMVVPAINDLQKVWGASASDVYAVGNGILHYNGRTWSKVANQAGYDVWGSSATDVFVVGSGGTILHGTP